MKTDSLIALHRSLVVMRQACPSCTNHRRLLQVLAKSTLIPSQGVTDYRLQFWPVQMLLETAFLPWWCLTARHSILSWQLRKCLEHSMLCPTLVGWTRSCLKGGLKTTFSHMHPQFDHFCSCLTVTRHTINQSCYTLQPLKASSSSACHPTQHTCCSH